MSRDPNQRALPFPAPAVLAPAPGREEPTLWVRRLVLKADPTGEPIRDVELVRGLNVVWSPAAQGIEQRATGHAAGKTLFCRLLRYCLGEDAFADSEDTSAIRQRFPAAVVAAEVRLGGETWAVQRSLNLPRDDRGARVDRIEQLSDASHAKTFDHFRQRIAAVAFDDEQRALFQELGGVADPWHLVLAWLTRDQECRLDGLLHWRHEETSYHSDVRAVTPTTRLDVLRIALRLHSNISSQARHRLIAAAGRAESIKGDVRQAQARLDALSAELAESLELQAERIWPPPQEPLQTDQAARDAHFQKLTQLADRRIRSAGALAIDPTLQKEEDELEELVERLARARQEESALQHEVEQQREHAQLLRADRTRRASEALDARYPTCPFDGTLIDVEKANFVCPLPRLPDPIAAAHSHEDAQRRLAEALDELSATESRLGNKKGEVARFEARQKALQARVEAGQQRVAERAQASRKAWAAKDLLRRLFESDRQLQAAREQEALAIEQQRQLQESQLVGLGTFSTHHLSHWFNALVQRVLAPEATGTIDLDGLGLHPRITWRGTRRSAALNSLKIVLCDLSAALCAVEGHVHLPAFLVHDSPREADLDSSTYARLFSAMLELGPDPVAAPFQYILTTNTEPPKGSVRSRVRLRLSTTDASERLFRVDL